MDDPEKYCYRVHWSCWFLVRCICDCWRNYLSYCQSFRWHSTKFLFKFEFDMHYIWFEIVEAEWWASSLKMMKIRTLEHIAIHLKTVFFRHNIDILAINYNSSPILINYDRFVVLRVSSNFKNFSSENWKN